MNSDKNALMVVAVVCFCGLMSACASYVGTAERIEPMSSEKPAGDACALLTKAEVEQATGSTVASVIPETEGSAQTKCTYEPGSGGLYPVVLEVSWEHGKAAMTLIQTAAPKMLAGSQNGSALGDASYFGPMDSGIWVLKGEKLLSLNFGLSQLSREKKIALARKALSRL